jgi:hypothetical protein
MNVYWGPGCPGNTNTGYASDSTTTWSSIPTDDYTGSGCSGQTLYTLNADTSAQYEWTVAVTKPGAVCHLYTYIPTKDAGTYATRYDFYWLPPGSNTWKWMFWPGQNINQENTSGWYALAGNFTMPQAAEFKITVRDDSAKDAQDRYLGIGDMHLTCP